MNVSRRADSTSRRRPWAKTATADSGASLRTHGLRVGGNERERRGRVLCQQARRSEVRDGRRLHGRPSLRRDTHDLQHVQAVQGTVHVLLHARDGATLQQPVHHGQQAAGNVTGAEPGEELQAAEAPGGCGRVTRRVRDVAVAAVRAEVHLTRRRHAARRAPQCQRSTVPAPRHTRTCSLRDYKRTHTVGRAGVRGGALTAQVAAAPAPQRTSPAPCS